MIDDILTVVWKERKERSSQQQDLRGKVVGLIFPMISLGMIAIYPPLAVGPDWIASPFSLVGSIIVPLMAVGMSIADSFAGERERRTLETLLASRLPDRSILFGKMGAPLLDSLEVTIILHLVSLAALNVGHWSGRIMLYTPSIALVNLVLSCLIALFASCLGVLLSLRASSVQQATQNLMVALMAPIMLLSMTIVIIGTVLPEKWRTAFETFFMEVVMTADFAQVILVVIGVLTLIDLGLLMAAMARFQRARLVLD